MGEDEGDDATYSGVVFGSALRSHRRVTGYESANKVISGC